MYFSCDLRVRILIISFCNFRSSVIIWVLSFCPYIWMCPMCPLRGTVSKKRPTLNVLVTGPECTILCFEYINPSVESCLRSRQPKIFYVLIFSIIKNIMGHILLFGDYIFSTGNCLKRLEKTRTLSSSY